MCHFLLLHLVVITVSSNLSLSEHIKEIVAKADQRTGNVIHRSFVSRKVNLFVRLQHVRALLEHNSVIWSALLKQDI